MTAVLVAYYLELLAPLTDPQGEWALPLLEQLSDQNQTSVLASVDLPAVIITTRGESDQPGPFCDTVRRTFTVRIRVIDRDPVDREKPRKADNPRNVTAITDKVRSLLSTDKGQKLNKTTPWLWTIDPRQTVTDFDAWQGQPGQWSGRDITVTGTCIMSNDGPSNPDFDNALPG